MLNLSYFTGGIAETNGWMVEAPEGVLLVDAPEGVADWLEASGVRPAALLLTHQHFDHVMDAARVKAKFGCPIYAHAAYSKGLTLEDLISMAMGAPLKVPAFEVDHVLAGMEQVSVGGVDFAVKHVPGHSPDSIGFYWAEQGLLFGGDILFAGSIGRTDFPGGSMKMLLAGIKEKILPLPDETRVLPGHGPETTVGEERQENGYLR